MSNKIEIKVSAKDDASNTIKKVSKQVQDFDKSQSQASKGSLAFAGAIGGVTASLVTMGTNIASQAIGKITDFLNESSKSAKSFQQAMIGLDIVMPRFGQDANKAKEMAKALGKELRIGTGSASEGLTNLVKAGLTLDQSGDFLKRFTNEAMNGKRETITLAEAVKNLTFAYATNNSALGNMSGINENFSDITEKGRESLVKQGRVLEKITDDQAKYQGMLELTNMTMGTSEAFVGTLTDKQASLEYQVTELQIALGDKLNPILAQLTDRLSVIVTENSPKVLEFFDKIIQHAKNAEPLFKGVGEVFTELGNTATSVFDTMKLAITEALGENNITKIKSAWETVPTIFETAKDLVINVLTEIQLRFAEVRGEFAEAERLRNKQTDILKQVGESAHSISAGKNNPIGYLVNIGFFENMTNEKTDLLNSPFEKQIEKAREFGYKYARGTDYAKGGMSIVGENGPELVDLPAGSKVVNNQTLNKTMGGIVNYNYFTNNLDFQSFNSKMAFLLR